MGKKNWPGGRRKSLRFESSRRKQICTAEYCTDQKCVVHKPVSRKIA